MADIYTRGAATASRLLAKYKQGTVILTRAGTPTPGASAWDEPTPGEPQSWTLNAAVKQVDQKYVNGDNIVSTDQQVTCSDFGDTPKPGDSLTVDGTPRTILGVVRKPGAGTLIAWVIIIKG